MPANDWDKNKPIYILGWLTISIILLQNMRPAISKYCDVCIVSFCWEVLEKNVVGHPLLILLSTSKTPKTLKCAIFMHATLLLLFLFLWALILQYVPNYTANLFLDVLSTVFSNHSSWSRQYFNMCPSRWIPRNSTSAAVHQIPIR